jgi:hypothetical protein
MGFFIQKNLDEMKTDLEFFTTNEFRFYSALNLRRLSINIREIRPIRHHSRLKYPVAKFNTRKGKEQ